MEEDGVGQEVDDWLIQVVVGWYFEGVLQYHGAFAEVGEYETQCIDGNEQGDESTIDKDDEEHEEDLCSLNWVVEFNVSNCSISFFLDHWVLFIRVVAHPHHLPVPEAVLERHNQQAR